MAANVTLAVLISDVRLYADQRGSGVATNGFLTDTEITRLLNLKLAELYDLLLSARGQDYYITSSTISIVASTATYSLPADFYELKSLTLEWGSNEHEIVRPVNSVGSRVKYVNDDSWSRGSRKGYRLRTGLVEFLPTPRSAVTCRIQYVPAFSDLTNTTPGTTDIFDGVNGWEKLVTLGVAIEALNIEEKYSGHLQPLYDEQLQRVRQLAADRDADQPLQIDDVSPEGGSETWHPNGRAFLQP